MVALVIAEHTHKSLSHTTLATIAAAAQMHSEVKVLVAGYQCSEAVNEVAYYEHVKEVIVIDHPSYEYQLPENVAELVAQMAPGYSHVVAPASTFGKNLLPRVCGILQVGQISDIVSVVDDKTFIRPIYAGNAYATVESLDKIKMVTVRTTAFVPVSRQATPATVRTLEIVIKNDLTRLIKQELSKNDRPELTEAKIVVSGGRGLQNADNFKIVEDIARQLNAAVGATRAAVDAGYVSNDYQVGQTGKIVAPDLYIAIGISGAIQHLAGIKDSKVIVAINKDPDAPIFTVADYGLVGDLFKILPELKEELIKLGYT